MFIIAPLNHADWLPQTLCSPPLEQLEPKLADTITGLVPHLQPFAAEPGRVSSLAHLVEGMVAMECIAVAQIFNFCEKLSIDRERFLQVILNGAARSDVVNSSYANPLDEDLLPRAEAFADWATAVEALKALALHAGFSVELPKAMEKTLSSLSNMTKHIKETGSATNFDLETDESRHDSDLDPKEALNPKTNVLVAGHGLMGTGIALNLADNVNTCGFDKSKYCMDRFEQKGVQDLGTAKGETRLHRPRRC